jgi:hypothetical protein
LIQQAAAVGDSGDEDLLGIDDTPMDVLAMSGVVTQVNLGDLPRPGVN